MAGFMPPKTDMYCTPQPYGTCTDTLMLIHCMQSAEYMCSSDIPYMGTDKHTLHWFLEGSSRGGVQLHSGLTRLWMHPYDK